MRAPRALFLLGALGLSAGELGLPFIRNYSPREYAAPSQNWAFAEGADGMVYAGNTGGVLEFDGNTWRLIPTRNRTCVRSLAQDDQGRIFVGAKNEFGYLAPDPLGQMVYVPLEGLVDPADRAFADVWAVLPARDGVYFATRERLFRYDGQGLRTWRADTSFTFAWKIHGRIYLYERGIGPVRLGPAGFVPLPGAERFVGENVNFMVPWGGGDSILLGSAHQGLFLFDGSGIQPFPTEADALLRACVVSHGVLLGDGNLAVGGMDGGCFVLDRQGRLIQHLDRRGGLQEERVNRLFTDRRSRLWMGLNRGITRVEWPSPFTAFGEESGLEGTVSALVRHRGDLYAGTSKGLFRLVKEPSPQGENPAPGPLWRFRKLAGISTQIWGFCVCRGRLLAANARGVYEVGGDRVAPILFSRDDRDALCLLPSRRDPSRLYVGLAGGLAVLRWDGRRWADQGRVPAVKAEVRTLAEGEDGALWLGTQASGVFRVVLPRGWKAPAPADVTAYGVAEGLPSLAHDFVRTVAGGFVVSTHAGFLHFNGAVRRFEPDPRFDALLPPGKWYADGVVEGPDGKFWMQAQEEATGIRATGYAAPGNRYRFEEAPWKRLADATLYAILPEADGVVWMGGPEGLVRYDPALESLFPWSSPPQVRRVSGPGNRILFGGAGPWTGADRLPYADNTLRLEFAAPGGVPDGTTQYQVRLEGSDREWSPWSRETFRDYTHLSEGRYRFLVRARNGKGQETPLGVLAFRILPPFYRSWWAFATYISALLGLGHGLVQWRLARSRAARRLLVRKVVERTDQLRRKTLQLEQAKTAAEAATRAKSEFLANMSHEIRTPLNTILGYSEILRDEVEEPRHREHLAAISDGGKALLGIIGDILDLSKVEAGRMELENAPVDLADLLEEVARTFSLRCREKRLELILETDPALPRILVVSQKHLRQILLNLVGNAVKFTAQGHIRLRLSQLARAGDRVDLAVQVEDTGIGIPEGQERTIFEAFQQVTGQDASRYGGTGLGLAISRRLADVMGGELSVESSEGQGSTFTLVLREVPVSREGAVSGGPEVPFRGEFLPATVLLVDDVKANRDLVRHFFEAGPLRFLEAGGGAEGVETARRFLPDLVIMDIRMAGMDGLQATRILKADGRLRAIPVILLTASTTAEEEGPVRESGAEGFLRKPVSRVQLATEMAKFLPCRPEPSAAPLLPEPVPALLSGPPPPLSELQALLDGEARAEWEGLKDVFFLDRMTDFSRRMGLLAECYQVAELKAWSAQVLIQAAHFDMENLPATFRRFPEVAEAIRSLSK